ncbi:MAG: hypothetical protein Q8P41_23835 [Pseudomonadota bacterium]|nr:hypothetical protein [Pseudomonadota bacterium]
MRLATNPPTAAPAAPQVLERLLLGQLPAACVGAKARVATGGDEEDWRVLLLVAARARPAECLPVADGDALAAWAASREAWRGARAEWLSRGGAHDEADAVLGPGGDDSARLRLALARGDGAAARLAAEGALVEEPRDVLACRTLALAALADGDAAWAIETTACGGLGERAPELVRLRAEALDRAGEYSAAEASYALAKADVHRAALLYQENPTPERLAAAARLLAPGPDGRTPPAALHALWMARLQGAEGTVEGLDASLPAAVARVVVRGAAEDVEAVKDAPGAPAAIARAEVAATHGDRAATEAALADALAAAPAAEPVHRARVALLLQVDGDVEAALADWAARDPDHVAAVGRRGPRDLPWAALVTPTWDDLRARHPDARMHIDAPAGVDAIGAAIRSARALPEPAARSDALAVLLATHPDLDALVVERYRSAPAPTSVPDHDP